MYFLLDIENNGCKIASQSRLLTGILTGIGRWNGGGDTPFADRRSGKPLSGTSEAEAERLAKVSRKAGRSCSDKNGQRPLEMISQTGAMSLESFGTRASLPGT